MVSVRDCVRSQPARYGVVLLTTVIIVVFSVLGSDPTGDPIACSDPEVVCLTTGPFGLIGADKWIHGIAYAGLMATLASAFVAPVTHNRHDRLVVLFCVAVLFGVSLELLQWPLPRSMEGLDAIANTIGAGLVTLLWQKRMDTVQSDGDIVTESELSQKK